MTRLRTRPIAVVGGGIAGLACAEYLSRCGRSVVLIEASEQLCSETSGALHGWFHTGSLYALLPNPQYTHYLWANFRLMLRNYRDFPGMNITQTNAGKLDIQDRPDGWFKTAPIRYVVARPSAPDFDLIPGERSRARVEKLSMRHLGWPFALQRFRARHRILASSVWESNEIDRERVPAEDFGFESRHHLVFRSYDRPMNTVEVCRDLVRSLLATGGLVLRSHELKAYDATPAGPVLIFGNERSLECEDVVLTLGARLQALVPEARVTTVASPLLVAYPAVHSLNFARLTPYVDRTVNHLRHVVDGVDYSLIGGGFASRVGDREGRERAARNLMNVAHKTFPKLKDASLRTINWGIKTEWGKERGIRNYRSVIRRVAPHVLAVLPGKFSLCFSLAERVAAHLNVGVTGLPPAFPRNAAGTGADDYVRSTRHEAAVLAHLRDKQAAPIELGRPA